MRSMDETHQKYMEAITAFICYMIDSMAEWSAYMTTNYEIAGSIPDTHILKTFLSELGLKRNPPSLVRTIG